MEQELAANLQTHIDAYLKNMNDLEFRKALNELRAVWVEGNNYITAAEPWTVIKTDAARAACILRTCINLIRIFAVLSAPIMPQTAENMLQRLGLSSDNMPSLKGFNAAQEMQAVKAGQPFEVGDLLFERITPERVEELKQKYGSAN